MSLMLADILRIKEERGYSVAKLSEYSGVPIGTLQKLLRGGQREPQKRPRWMPWRRCCSVMKSFIRVRRTLTRWIHSPVC